MSEFDEVDFTSVPDGKRKRKRATSVPDSKTKWSQKGKKPSLSLSVFGITVSEEDRDIFTTSTVLRNWYSIPRSKVSSAQLNMIQKDLTISPRYKDYITQKDKESVNLYHLTKDLLFVPPAYGVKAFGNPDVDLRRSGNDLQHKFSDEFPLRVNLGQIKAYDRLMETMSDFLGTGYLSLPPGGGKTTTGLKICSDIGKCMGVLVTKTFLVCQWKKRIEQFIPGARIGIIFGKQLEYKDCDVVIIMLQTLLYHLEDPVIETVMSGIETVIIDEARHVNAEQFCKILPILTSRHMLALDGTPFRKDGLDKILERWIGPVSFKIRRKYEFPVRVVVTELDYPETRVKFLRLTNVKPKFNKSLMMTDLVKVEERNETIIDTICTYLESNANHSGRAEILVLSARTEHLLYLEKHVNARCPDVSTGQLDTTVSNSMEKMEAIELRRVIFATDRMADDALDIPSLRILFYATPTPNVEQSTPRIMRGTENRNPIIFDFEDYWGPWQDDYDNRHKFFRKEGYEIEYPTLELAEKHQLRGVTLHEKNGRYVLHKPADTKEETSETDHNMILKKKLCKPVCPF